MQGRVIEWCDIVGRKMIALFEHSMSGWVQNLSVFPVTNYLLTPCGLAAILDSMKKIKTSDRTEDVMTEIVMDDRLFRMAHRDASSAAGSIEIAAQRICGTFRMYGPGHLIVYHERIDWRKIARAIMTTV